MKKMYFLTVVLLLMGCGDGGGNSNGHCKCHVNDTEFTLQTKMLGVSLETAHYTVPSTSQFKIDIISGGAYCLVYRKDSMAQFEKVKPAVISFKVLSKKLVLDTTSVHVAPPDSIPVEDLS